MQPTNEPSSQPADYPTAQPSDLPTSQPSMRPTSQPSVQPTVQPSALVPGEWASAFDGLGGIAIVAGVGDAVWACGTRSASGEGSLCVSIGAAFGTQEVNYPFFWINIVTTLQKSEHAEVMICGSTVSGTVIRSDIATCAVGTDNLVCTAKLFDDT